jgi:serine-type D-Ala-D-Ala carboxypeptidase/endopeptidase (penicillin-binding protein 4)
MTQLRHCAKMAPRRHRLRVYFVWAAASIVAVCISPAARAQSQKKAAPGTPRAATAPARKRADIAAFRASVNKILAAPEVSRGYWGLLVEDADSGEVLFAQNSDRYFTPASNAKLFTTALALAMLGADYKFHTTLESSTPIGNDGTLAGDLVLVGRGDPNLSNRAIPYDKKTDREGPPEKALSDLADAVVARGLKQVSGNIVGDDSYFAGGRYPSGWSIDDMLWNYGAPVSALEINDGTLFVEIAPGPQAGAPASYTIEPWVSGFYEIHNELVTGAPGSKQELTIERDPGAKDIVLRGSIPADAQQHSLGLANTWPAEYAAALLKQLLEERGVKIYGKAEGRHLAAAPADANAPVVAPTVLAEHVSLPLAEAVRVAAKVSQNLHAEMLLRDAAKEKTGDVSFDTALQFAEQFREGIGIADDEMEMSDACGLSRRDLVTLEAVAKLLRWVSQQPWSDIYRASLPIAGEDGTLSDRMLNTPAAGHVWAKTGTLGHVDALSGYATSARGEHLIFSFFGNNHMMKSKPAEDVLDAITVAMVKDLGAARRNGKK